MGKIATDKMQLNAIVPKSLGRVVSARADALSLTRGKFVALILGEWAKAGAPAVSAPDKSIRDEVMRKLRDEDSRAANSHNETIQREKKVFRALNRDTIEGGSIVSQTWPNRKPRRAS